MRLRPAALMLAAALLFGGCATTTISVEDRIRALEQDQVQAAVTGNRAVLERLFAPRFQLINPAGAVASREELLTMLASGTAPYRSASYVTESVRAYGQVVVSTGMETVVTAQGASQRRRITHVWERDGSSWRLALRHATLVAAPP